MALTKYALPAFGLAVLLMGNAAYASTAEIKVDFTNNAPMGGTLQTPVWAGFHDGSFNTFTTGQAASAGLERLAEDGNTAVLSSEFGTANGRVDGVLGMAPIGPGGTASNTFSLDTTGKNQYFSYGSMLLTSSDFFIGNGNPMAHDLSTLLSGMVSSLSFDVFRVYDAGTEVNDFHTSPAATLFGATAGQSMPDQGLAENGVVTLVSEAGLGSESLAAKAIFDTFLNANGVDTERLNFSSFESIGSFTLTNVSAVPIPGAVFLLAPALMGFLGLRRKAAKTA